MWRVTACVSVGAHAHSLKQSNIGVWKVLKPVTINGYLSLQIAILAKISFGVNTFSGICLLCKV